MVSRRTDYAGAMMEDDSQPELTFSEDEASQLLETISSVDETSLVATGQATYVGLFHELKESMALRLLGDAFSYGVSVEWGGKSGFRAHLEPEVPGEHPWPQSLTNIPGAVLATWNYLCDRISHPVIRAHFADLVLSSASRPDLSKARLYISSLEEILRNQTWNQHDRYRMAIRALSLCNQFRLTDLLPSALDAISKEVDFILSSSEPLNKSFLWMFRVYRSEVRVSSVDSGVEQESDALYDRLWDGLRHLAIDDYNAEAVLGIVKNSEHLKDVQARHVRTEIEAGKDAAEPFQKLHHLERAAALAKRYELPDLHDDAIRFLQKARDLTPDWQKHSSTIRIPQAAIELELRRLTSRDNWQSPLKKILELPAPTGDHDANLRQAQKLATQSPLRHLFTNKIIGVHGLPEKTRTSPEEAIAADLIFVESLAAQSHAHLIGDALNRMKSYFPDLVGRDIAVYMSEELGANPDLAATFGRGMDEYWAGRYEQVSFLLLFQIEAAIRELLMALEVPLYRIQVSESRGRFPSLDTYLEKLLEEGFDLDWARTIKCVLLSEGMNVRNLVAHGYPVTIGKTEAVLLLRIFGIFSLVVPHKPSDAIGIPDRVSEVRRKATHRRQLSAFRETRRVLHDHRRSSRNKKKRS